MTRRPARTRRWYTTYQRLVRAYPGTTARELARLAGEAESSARAALLQLARDGKVERHRRSVGSGAAFCYHPPSEDRSNEAQGPE